MFGQKMSRGLLMFVVMTLLLLATTPRASAHGSELPDLTIAEAQSFCMAALGGCPGEFTQQGPVVTYYDMSCKTGFYLWPSSEALYNFGLRWSIVRMHMMHRHILETGTHSLPLTNVCLAHFEYAGSQWRN